MADPASALPPSSTLPAGEDDFAAICGVLQETARGRRFLEEFARRHRNTDTVMVLDAVERLEATLKTQQAGSAAPPDRLPAGLAPLIDEGFAALTAPHADGDPARTALQALRDVSQTLRACGADLRICDLIDGHTDAIDAGLAGSQAAAAAALAVFGRLRDLVDTSGEKRIEPDGMPGQAPSLPPPPAAAPEPAPTAQISDTSAPDSPVPAAAAPETSDRSLGAALLADGVVALPAPADDDPLAVFRRMPQTELLAFCS